MKLLTEGIRKRQERASLTGEAYNTLGGNRKNGLARHSRSLLALIRRQLAVDRWWWGQESVTGYREERPIIRKELTGISLNGGGAQGPGKKSVTASIM